MIDIIRSETPMTPGLYAMSEAAYHADPLPEPSLSRSIAQLLVTKSPRHARAAHPRLTKQDDVIEKNSRERDIGSAAHALLLRQPTPIVVIEHDEFRTKDAKDKRTAAQKRGAVPLLEKDYEVVKAMVKEAHEHLADETDPAIRNLISADPESITHNEITAVWRDRCGDAWARARMDHLHIAPKRITIIDYKTSAKSAEPDAVKDLIFKSNYHFQDAFYRRGMRALVPEIDRHEIALDFLFIVQEQEPPFEIAVTYVDAPGRMIGEKMVSDAFLMWRKCWEENNWPGYPRGIFAAEMPPWVDTRWTEREISHPYFQKLGFDPVLPFESQPYRPRQIMEPN